MPGCCCPCTSASDPMVCCGLGGWRRQLEFPRDSACESADPSTVDTRPSSLPRLPCPPRPALSARNSMVTKASRRTSRPGLPSSLLRGNAPPAAPLFICIYVCMYVYICMYVCMYIYIYIYMYGEVGGRRWWLVYRNRGAGDGFKHELRQHLIPTS